MKALDISHIEITLDPGRATRLELLVLLLIEHGMHELSYQRLLGMVGRERKLD